MSLFAVALITKFFPWLTSFIDSFGSFGLSKIVALFYLYFLVGRILSVRAQAFWQRRKLNKQGIQVWGFFHPHCMAGGGGERVLWKTIQVLAELEQERANDKRIQVIVYTVDPFRKNYGSGESHVVLYVVYVCCEDSTTNDFSTVLNHAFLHTY
jgi:thiol-disulfide isomerase/thioredoxin